MVMATPIDSALLAAQTYKPRKPAADTRPRGSVFAEDERAPGAAVLSRRTHSGVAVTLSAEALELLSEQSQTTGRSQARDHKEPVPQTEVASATGVSFELPAGTPPPQREAPFAHVARNEGYRAVQPGSRLDISV